MFFRRDTLRDRWIRTLPVIGASVVIFWVSSMPDASPPDLGFEWQDKVFHAAAYLIYALAMFLAVWVWSGSRPVTWTLSVGGVLSAVYAISDEWHQSFVPGRHATVDDVIADLVGIILAALLFRSLLRRFLLRR